jgi:hypothetical protein
MKRLEIAERWLVTLGILKALGLLVGIRIPLIQSCGCSQPLCLRYFRGNAPVVTRISPDL